MKQNKICVRRTEKMGGETRRDTFKHFEDGKPN